MSDPCDGIKTLLVAAGVGPDAASSPTADWSIHIGQQPKTPTKCITVRRTGGMPSWPKWLIDFPSVQIHIRGSQNGYRNAHTKAQEVKDALLGLPSQDIGSDRWVSVLAIGDIVGLGDDENNHPEFALNFALIIEPASGTHRESL